MAPPMVPGSPIHLAKSELSCFFETWSERGDMSSPPDTHTLFSCHSIHFNVFRIIIPSNASKANTRLVPLQINTIGRFFSCANFQISWSFGTSELSRSSKKYLVVAGVWNEEYFKRSLSISRNGSMRDGHHS